MRRTIGALVRDPMLALLIAFATEAAAAEPFNQEAPIAPYGIPTDPAQAVGDKAAIGAANKVAPLPPLPPEPAPPKFKDTTKNPRK